MKYVFEGNLDGPITIGMGTKEVKSQWNWSSWPFPRDTFVSLALEIIGAKFKVKDEDLKALHGKIRVTIEKLPDPPPKPDDPAVMELMKKAEVTPTKTIRYDGTGSALHFEVDEEE